MPKTDNHVFDDAGDASGKESLSDFVREVGHLAELQQLVDCALLDESFHELHDSGSVGRRQGFEDLKIHFFLSLPDFKLF